jgi:hypothetical protein
VTLVPFVVNFLFFFGCGFAALSSLRPIFFLLAQSQLTLRFEQRRIKNLRFGYLDSLSFRR